MRHLFRRLGHALLLGLALATVLLEATLWRWLTRFGQALSRLAPFAVLERLVERLSPRGVALAFLLPFVPMVIGLKFSELWLLTHRHYVWAAILIIGAKVVGVAFSTRVFAIARPKLLQLGWFAWGHGHVTRLLALGHALLEGWPAWQRLRAMAHRLREAARAAWRRLVPAGGGLRRALAAAKRRVR